MQFLPRGKVLPSHFATILPSDDIYGFFQIHDCSTSIIYHCRKHIGDYPYRCTECGHAELSKAAISSHLIEKGHMGFILAKNNGRDIDDIQQGSLRVAWPEHLTSNWWL